MKSFNSLIAILFIVSSCTNNNQLNEQSEQLIQLKKSNDDLIKQLDSLNNSYIAPFKIYESIVIKEQESSPDSLIKEYKNLIKKYPNSFWKHESERRINNIQKRKKYWTEKNGWKLDKIPKKPTFDEQVISCPGC